MTSPATIADALAYLAITGGTKGLHVNTRIALYPYKDFVAVPYKIGDHEGVTHRDVLNDEGRKLAETSKLWKAHQALVAKGFRWDCNQSKVRMSFLSYDHRTDLCRNDRRGAFISHKSAYAQAAPDEELPEGRKVWEYFPQ